MLINYDYCLSSLGESTIIALCKIVTYILKVLYSILRILRLLRVLNFSILLSNPSDMVTRILIIL